MLITVTIIICGYNIVAINGIFISRNEETKPLLYQEYAIKTSKQTRIIYKVHQIKPKTQMRREKGHRKKR
jgi:hypothetical protein